MSSHGGYDNTSRNQWLKPRGVSYKRRLKNPGKGKSDITPSSPAVVAGPLSRQPRLQRRAVQLKELMDIVLTIRELRIERRWGQLYDSRAQKRYAYEEHW